MFSWKISKQIVMFSGYIFIPLPQLLITWSSLQFSDYLALRTGGETMLTLFSTRVFYIVDLSLDN